MFARVSRRDDYTDSCGSRVYFVTFLGVSARRFGPSLYGFAAALYGNGKQDLAYFLDGADVETIDAKLESRRAAG